jgi:hypothetical protein
MRITVQVPDDLEDRLRERADDLDTYVLDALREKVEREEHHEIQKRLLDKRGSGADASAYALNKLDRYDGDRDLPERLQAKREALKKRLSGDEPGATG